MTLQWYELNLASRQLIINVLSDIRKDADATAARNARSIREAFQLREAQREIDSMEHELAEDNKKKKDKGEPVEKDMVSWDDLIDTPAKRFTLDKGYVAWLKEQLDRDWSQRQRMAPTGQVETFHIPPPIDQLVAIADLLDALQKDEPVRSEDGK